MLLGLLLLILAGLSPDSRTEQYNRLAQEIVNSSRPIEISFVRVVQDFHSSQGSTDARSRKKNAEELLMDWLDTLFEFHLTDVLIVIFTGVLAIKTSGLYRETASLRTIADEQREDILRSTKAAESSAAAAHRSADVAELALTTAERPFFVPRRPVLKMWRYGLPGMPVSEPAEYQRKLDYGVTNLGRTVGFLKELTCTVIFQDVLPKTPVYDKNIRLNGKFPLAQSTPYEANPIYSTDPFTKLSTSELNSLTLGTLRMYFFGYIRYTDVFGYLHTEGFCFRFHKFGFDNTTSECALVAGDEYNYSRSEKIPLEGVKALSPRGAELPIEENIIA
jgi:hypothetical protein